MKKLIFLFTLSLLMVSMAWGQGIETFDNMPSTGTTYSTGTFTGQDGSTWNYVQCRSDFSITGKALMIGRNRSPQSNFYSGTISGGIGTLSFDYQKSFSTNVNLNVYVNDNLVHNVQTSATTVQNSGTITVNVAGDFVLKFINSSNSNGQVHIDNVTWTGYSASQPLISLTPTSLTGFTYVYGNGPSVAQSFAVTGSNLTGNLSVSSVGTNYVVSATESGTYGTSLSLTQSGGSVSATVYVKLNSGLAIGNYNSQDITVSGGGATSQTVSCSGEVSSPPPPNAPTASSATSVANTSFTANWGSVSGATGYKLDVYTLESGGNASDLFISEYIEGGSNNKYIELYNGTGASVDLSNYVLRQYNNGSPTVSYTLPLSGTLADGATYVIANSSGAIYANPDLSTTSSVMGFNGDDALELYRTDTSTTVDIFGCIGQDPGSAWSSGSHSTENKTLVRKSTVMGGVTTSPSSGFPTLETEWDVYAQNTSTYLGSHTFSGGLTKAYVSGYQDLSVSGTSQSVTGLTQNTTYYYVVRALNTYGTSDDSNEIEVTTTTSSPLITLSTDTLSDFYYVLGHGPSAEQTFTVSGENLTANISIAAPTNYEISLSSGSGYTSPLTLTQSGGTVATTTVYVRLKDGLSAGTYESELITASSSGASSQTVSCSGSIEAPLSTSIPYSEDFSSGLTGVYTYSVTGSKAWSINSDAAQCNGYGSSAEEQWLILPGINFNDYSAERMTFNTSAYYGAIDANNYLKLMYSTNYLGLGDPTSATWTEISFTNPALDDQVVSSGVLDISAISGTSVFLAFKYYSSDQPTRWNVDNISIYEAAPIIVASSALDAFSYKEGSGPSDEQSFTVSGADLTADIVITAPSNYEISLTTGESFVSSSPITLTESSGSVSETTIYVRLKSGLDIGTYNQDITISSTGATGETVSCSGEVLDPTLQIETFVNYPEGSSSYNDGTFTGIDGSTWTYVQCAGQVTITGKAVTFAKNASAELYSGTIHGGIGTLSFDYMQAFSTDVSLEVYVNETLVTTVSSSSQQSVVLNSGAIVVNQPGDFVLRFSNPSGGQVTIDNIEWTPCYDIPEDEVVTIGGADFLISGGHANINAAGSVPAFNNPNLVPAFSQVLTLIGPGPWYILIDTDALYGAYYRGGAWTTVENSDGLIEFNINPAKNMDLPIILGNEDPNTLPVELSTFTVDLYNNNNAMLRWVTQSETGVLGFRILRNNVEDVTSAALSSELIPATNTSQQQIYQYPDTNLTEYGTYYYWLMVADIDGSESIFGPVHIKYDYEAPETPEIPELTELKNVYPNPFNPSTNISYSLAQKQDVKFSIFNSRGQLVKQISVGEKAAGNHSLVWDGSDNNGRTVTTGVYFIRMLAGKDSFFKKAVLMK